MKPIRNIEKVIGYDISPYPTPIVIKSTETHEETNSTLHTTNPSIRLTIFWKENEGCGLTIEVGEKMVGFRIREYDIRTPQQFVHKVKECMGVFTESALSE